MSLASVPAVQQADRDKRCKQKKKKARRRVIAAGAAAEAEAAFRGEGADARRFGTTAATEK